MRHRIALAALVAALGAVLPAAASADSPFPTYRQAAVDQYGSPSQQPSGQRPVGGQGAPGRKPAKSTGGVQGSASRPGALALSPSRTRGGAIRVAPESSVGELPRGSLPFTGRDLTLVVLIAVGLLAAGALCAAAARATRRRRAT